MEEHFVYILQSEVDGSFYVGSTQNVVNRLESHNQGRGRYTRKKMPWKIVFSKGFSSKSEALKTELKIKKRKSRGYLLQVISGEIAL